MDSADVCVRCGARANARRIREIADRDVPVVAGGPGRPVGGVLRFLLQRLDDDPLDVRIGDLPWGTGRRLVTQAVHAAFQEAPPPGADRVSGGAQPP
ncbi:hypothetical protein ADK41_26855 [Streptomyces caelestis]|uniref:Uncharacterized protein n=1 Tax=Streptomyces caelestis TaxID=36816 RepID=A0A0M8QM51_9ACTN|nr:hypothetical protein ADK41_26855 [Streptomyces caelestis]